MHPKRVLLSGSSIIIASVHVTWPHTRECACDFDLGDVEERLGGRRSVREGPSELTSPFSSLTVTESRRLSPPHVNAWESCMKHKERNYSETSEAHRTVGDQPRQPDTRGRAAGQRRRSEVARLGRGGQPARGSDREASDALGDLLGYGGTEFWGRLLPPALLCAPVIGSTCACGCWVPMGHGPLHRAEASPCVAGSWRRPGSPLCGLAEPVGLPRASKWHGVFLLSSCRRSVSGV